MSILDMNLENEKMNKKYYNALFLRIPKTASTSVVPLVKKTKILYKAQNFFKSRQNIILYFDTRQYLNVMERSQGWFNLNENNIFPHNRCNQT